MKNGIQLELLIDFGRFFKDGKPLSQSESALLMPDGSLLLRNGTERSKGRYSCRATNAAGTASLDVDVQLISGFCIQKQGEGGGELPREAKSEWLFFFVPLCACPFLVLSSVIACANAVIVFLFPPFAVRSSRICRLLLPISSASPNGASW